MLAFLISNPWRSGALGAALFAAGLAIALALSQARLDAETASHKLTKQHLAQAQLNRQALEKGIADQAAAIDALADAGKKAEAAAREAEKRAAKQRGRTEALRSRLLAESRQTGGNPAATLTESQKEAWNALR